MNVTVHPGIPAQGETNQRTYCDVISRVLYHAPTGGVYTYPVVTQ